MPKQVSTPAQACPVFVPADKSTYPPLGIPVLAQLQRSGNPAKRVEAELIHVDEDDVSWRTADDKSELSYNWDVISWKHIPAKT